MTEAPTFLTVRELAALLRVKERKVYDLASRGEVPCSRATGKLLFPEAEIRAWIEGKRVDQADGMPPPIVLGSHDPLLDWALRASGAGLASFNDGSQDGLTRFCRGEGVATGLHLFDQHSGTWNVPAVEVVCARRNAVLIGFAERRRGLVVRPDGPLLKGIEDLGGLRIAPRQKAAGTEILFASLAAQKGLDLSRLKQTPVARTETEAVEAVKRGEADVTFGLESLAILHDLTFIPMVEERFDLLVDRRAWFDTPLGTLAGFLRSDAFAARAAATAGYSIEPLGVVRWNA